MENPHPMQTQHSSDRWMRFLLAAGILMVLLIVAAVSAYTWFALYGPCKVDTVQAASTALINQLKLFDSMYQSIPALTPVVLIGPVTQMQQILMDTKEVVVPACLQLARNELITGMETVIRALLAIMASESEATVTGLLEKSTTHLDNFTAELELINKCTPFCP